MPYNNLVSRVDAAGDMPQQVAEQIVGVVETQSMALRLGRRVPVTTKDSRVPVLTAVPDAYWVVSDTGLKQTSEVAFTNQALTAEELAVIVPVPITVLDDSEFDLWASVKPLLARAFASKLDQAVFFGTGKPASWGASLVEAATTAAQTIESSGGSSADYGRDVLLAAAAVAAAAGRAPTAAVVRPGWQYLAGAQRTSAFDANPVTETRPFPLSIAGLTIATDPISWNAAAADAVIADFQSVLVGVRQDIRFEIFDTGVITDNAGVIQYNLLQQDLAAMRCTMRVGYLLAQPATVTGTAAVPVSVLTPYTP